MPTRALPALVLFLASLSTAQSPTIVSPTAALTTTSYGANTYPFSLPAGTYQQVHSASSFSVTG